MFNPAVVLLWECYEQLVHRWDSLILFQSLSLGTGAPRRLNPCSFIFYKMP